MKGFPRRGSDRIRRRASGRGAGGLNEGLPQKGKRYLGFGNIGSAIDASMKGFPRRGSDLVGLHHGVFVRGLNEGLPQKGKRYPRKTRARKCAMRLNEGLPQKGKRLHPPAHVPGGLESASMKGFPRRGSDPGRTSRTPSPPSSLNEGLPQKGKRSAAFMHRKATARSPQ